MQINSSGISDLANTSFSTSLVEGRIGTNYIDWQSNGNILLKNTVKLGGSGIRAMNNLKYITDEWSVVDTAVAYASSGSFTIPTGVTEVWALLVGGGGGGGGAYSYTTGSSDTTTTNYAKGGDGGDGGAGLVKLDVVAGATSIAFTIGAGGGGGAANGNGSAGGASQLAYYTFGMTSYGGDGAGSNGSVGSAGYCDFADFNMGGTYTASLSTVQAAVANDVYPLQLRFTNTDYDYIRSQATMKATASRPAIAYSYAGSYKMGANGRGGLPNSGVGDGGVGGGVFFFYKAP